MVQRMDSSPQTLAVLAALAVDPASWRHGYDLARETALRSGTLYPILVRLADRGYLDTRWEEEQPQGRPRRHLYRLTALGVARAAESSAAARPKGRAATRLAAERP